MFLPQPLEKYPLCMMTLSSNRNPREEHKFRGELQLHKGNSSLQEIHNVQLYNQYGNMISRVVFDVSLSIVFLHISEQNTSGKISSCTDRGTRLPPF